MGILTINSGSSSVKVSLYELGDAETLIFKGTLDRIGVEGSQFLAKDAAGKHLVRQDVHLPDHIAAFKTLFAWLSAHKVGESVHAVGHRLVHGGADHIKPALVTREVVKDLNSLIPLAPDHLPHEIKAIETVGRIFPNLPQVACFDTAFHRRMPLCAQRFALPSDLMDKGVMRYGFHGLSYEYLFQELTKEAGVQAANGRIVMAHLGNGASMAAIYKGDSRDTTMGMTPTGGLVMSARCGDLDPGVLMYLLQVRGMTPEALNYMLNHESGLLGVSCLSPDMQDLLEQEKKNPRAAEAVALFCYQAKKHLGSLAAVLGGLETLIFAGGIGENSSVVRARICSDLEFLGIKLDHAHNDAGAPIISSVESRVTVRVMKTNEELMIARHTQDLLASQS